MRSRTVISTIGALLLPVSLVAVATGPADAGLVVPECFGRTPTQPATAGDDSFTGTPGTEVWSLEAGNDNGNALGGVDFVCGNDDGDAFLGGGAGNDRINGGDGADFLSGDSGGDAGKDLLLGAAGADDLVGDRGADELRGGPGGDLLDISQGDRFQAGADQVFGGGGNDVVDEHSDGFVDVIDCGPGRDLVYADRRDRVRRDCEVVRHRAPAMDHAVARPYAR